jgi:hypothetical protein
MILYFESETRKQIKNPKKEKKKLFTVLENLSQAGRRRIRQENQDFQRTDSRPIVLPGYKTLPEEVSKADQTTPAFP